MNNKLNRRDFLLASSAVSLASLLPSPLNAQADASHLQKDEAPVFGSTPRDTTLKFNSDGSRRPFAGNTVICHLPQQCMARDTIAALGDALRSSSFAHKLGVLPSDSYHMTVFSGPNDQDRSRYGWPADLPADLPIGECNRIIGQRIANFRMQMDLPIRVRIDHELTLGLQRASGLRIAPVNASENAKLRTLRDRLAAEVFRLRAKDHASYGFHISLAYQMSPLTVEEQNQYQAILKHHLPIITSVAPVIELGIPEFCTFEDMYRFEIHTLLTS